MLFLAGKTSVKSHLLHRLNDETISPSDEVAAWHTAICEDSCISVGVEGLSLTGNFNIKYTMLFFVLQWYAVGYSKHN